MSTTKILAGGLVAASSAVCGSYFGVLGTVGGAAAGSVVTALSTEIYQRFLEHARDRIRPGSSRSATGRSAGTPAAYDQYEQGRYEQAPAPAARRRWLPRMIVVSLVLFALGMGAVSGIEWVRGEPLSGGSKGTSVGHLLGGGGLGSTVDGLLGGGTSKSDDNSGDDQTDKKNDHGLVGGLLGGLTGN